MSCSCPLPEMVSCSAAGDGATRDGGPGKCSVYLGAGEVEDTGCAGARVGTGMHAEMRAGADGCAGDGIWLATLRMLGEVEKECNATWWVTSSIRTSMLPPR